MSNYAELVFDDCIEAFKFLKDNSIDAVITDPPYFLDQLKNDWNADMRKEITKGSQVTSLPAGMKFDPKQGIEFQKFMSTISEEAFRVLKPGGFFLSFSAPRLVHRLGVAVEDEGFNIRDLWGWIYTQNQVKAMSVNHFLKKRDDISKKEKKILHDQFLIWKTPQIKSCIEPIICAQKPPEGTFLDNWRKHKVGLINTNAKLGVNNDMFPANIMTSESINSELDKVFLVPKPNKAEKGSANKHTTVKPISLMAHLINLTTPEDSLILDPFNGSGTTGLGALLVKRNYLGFEVNKEYFELTKKRFTETIPEFSWQEESGRISKGKTTS